jgi:uncharacterized protein
MLRRQGWKSAVYIAAILAIWAGVRCAASAAEVPFNTKDPVFGAACQTCVWGGLAEWVREAMALDGKNIRICYNCNGFLSPIIVAEQRRPPALTRWNISHGQATRIDDPVDFGVTSLDRAEWAYLGVYEYRAYGAHRNMRAIAFIETPNYLVAAVHVKSGIHSLNELKSRKGLRVAASADPLLQSVLDYYGLTDGVLKANGDTITHVFLTRAEQANQFDLMLSANGAWANSMESRFWPAATLKYRLRFLPLADPLRAKLARQFSLREVTMPRGYMPGVDEPVPTVARQGQVIYGRADMPEKYAYELARALDRHRGLLPYMFIPFYYDPRTVAKMTVVPLDPGAARYYRQVGYLK